MASESSIDAHNSVLVTCCCREGVHAYKSGQVFAPKYRIYLSRWTTTLPCLQSPKNAARRTQPHNPEPPTRTHISSAKSAITLHGACSDRSICYSRHTHTHTHTHTCLSRDDHAAEQVWNRCACRQKCQAHERRWQTARGGGEISSSSGTTKIRNLPKATFPKYFSMSQQACPFRRRQLTRTLRPALPSTTPSSTRIKLSSQWISRTTQPTSSPR